MKIPFFTLALLLLAGGAFAQHPIEGSWEGTITKGGIHSDEGDDLEMYLEVGRKGRLTGYAVVYTPLGRRLETKIEGKIHHDRSVSIVDLEFEAGVDSTLLPDFYRKYQLIYHRSIWKSTLNGYWQELTPHYFSNTRRRGRIFLKRGKASKA